MTGPTSAAAENSAAVLALITAKCSSSVVSRFLAAASCITSPSAMIEAAVGQDVERFERADIDHHAEGLAEQEVADQHAGLVAPDHARRLPAAPQVALVDDVVVQQRGRVHELDAGRELDVAIAGIAEHLGRGERQHRAQALAAGRDQVVGDLRDHLDVGAGLGQDQFVDPAHVGRGQSIRSA